MWCLGFIGSGVASANDNSKQEGKGFDSRAESQAGCGSGIAVGGLPSFVSNESTEVWELGLPGSESSALEPGCFPNETASGGI